ncbi:IS607 family element RNA-guided endonuclease TnpB [Actinocorallia lasiicapitis]
MSRIAAFRFTLRPTAEQEEQFRTIGGAARLGWNVGLAKVKEGLDAREAGDLAARIPWTSIDLINTINAWRRAEFDGADGDWRKGVPAVIFEETVVDLARALARFKETEDGKQAGPPVGFPQFKAKRRTPYSFRIRNQTNGVRVGADGAVRSIRIPKIGDVRIREDTRRLRRLLRSGVDDQGAAAKARAKIAYVTVKQEGERWVAAVCVKLPDLHPERRHAPRPEGDLGGFLGVDLGLIDYVVVAGEDGVERGRVAAPRVHRCRIEGEKRRAKAVSRKMKGSKRRRKAARKLGAYHRKTAAIRRHEQHRVANELVKSHDRFVFETLTLRYMLRNHKIALSLSDAAFGNFVRIVSYKAAWHGGIVLRADPFFPSTKLCSGCGLKNKRLPLSERALRCSGCGLEVDRDLNAAINLAREGRAICERLGHVPDPGPGSTGPGHQRPSRGRVRHRHPGAAAPAPATAGSPGRAPRVQRHP